MFHPEGVGEDGATGREGQGQISHRHTWASGFISKLDRGLWVPIDETHWKYFIIDFSASLVSLSFGFLDFLGERCS